MLEIWGRPNSNNVMSVMWTVGELGIEHHRHNLGGTFGGLDSDAFRAMNPNGRIPVIKHDGNVLYESTTIVRYLANVFDDGTLWSSEPYQRARADQWMDWFKSTFYPAFFPVFWELIRTPEVDRDMDVVKTAADRTFEVAGILERALSENPWLAGDRFSIADIPVGACMYRFFNLTINRPSLPAVEDWYGRLCARPAFRQHVMIPFGTNNTEWLALEKQFA